MKIFSRTAEKEKPAAAKGAPTSPQPTAPAGPAAAAGAAPPTPTPAQAPSPDISAIIDANVKEMSEKIARLATSIEGDKGDRADFEAKLEQMEERMRKLSALTEMISAQYNPFVGAAPSENEALPPPEFGLAAPPLPYPAAPANASGGDPLASVASALVPPAPPLDAQPEDPFAATADDPTFAPPGAAAFEEGALPDASPAFAPPASAPDAAMAADDDASPARLWTVRPGFGSSMLMLSWADMLLKNAPDRNALLQLLDYYHNIAWIGPPARDQLLAYADGIRQNAGVAPAADDWRAPLDVHEKSLLFVEKLRAITDGRNKGD